MNTLTNPLPRNKGTDLQVAYQDVTTRYGTIVGKEALARFPSVYSLEAALATIRMFRQMNSLTVAIVTRVCREIARLSDGLPINVNIPIDCLTMGVFDTIRRLLGRFAIPERSLAIELLEYPAFAWNKERLDVANAFRRIGVPIYLDDFRGATWQQAVIQGFHFDAIKIDQSLTKDPLQLSKASSLIADAGVETIIVEGVETRKDLDRVLIAAQTIEGYVTVHLQGFFFSRPHTAPSSIH